MSNSSPEAHRISARSADRQRDRDEIPCESYGT